MTDPGKVAIIGGGKMASNIVDYLMQYDMSIVWYIRNNAVLDEKKRRIEKKISRLHKVSSDNQENVSGKLERVSVTNRFDDVRDAGIIIECVSEAIESKRAVFNELQGTNALLFSNTSSLPLDSFIPENMPGQSAGLHFFYPVQIKQFVELNVHDKTELAVLDKMVQFVRGIGKQALVLTEEHHFVLNRIFLTYLAQSCCAVQMYNIGFDRFDHEIEKSLFPIGPFTFMKNVGFDIMSRSVEMYSRRSSYPGFFIPMQQVLESAKERGGRVTNGTGMSGDNELAQKAAFEVKSVFVNTVYHELAAKYVDDHLLVDAIADYAGLTRDSVDRILNDVTPSLTDTLRRLYNATSWNVYSPSMLLLETIKNQDKNA